MHAPPDGPAVCICLVGRMEGRVPMPSGGHGSTHRVRPSWQCTTMMSVGGDGGYVILNNIFYCLMFYPARARSLITTNRSSGRPTRRHVTGVRASEDARRRSTRTTRPAWSGQRVASDALMWSPPSWRWLEPRAPSKERLQNSFSRCHSGRTDACARPNSHGLVFAVWCQI